MANDKTTAPQVDFSRLPRHVAIILDGNGRWAKKRGLPRTAGHAAGAESFRTIAYYCKDLGIPYLTVYAFSTENWKRPMEEVSAIMDLLQKYLLEALEKMERDGFRVHFFGDLEGLPPKLRDLCLRTLEEGDAMDGTRFQVNVCLNYGGRDEILRAAKAWAADVQAGRTGPIPRQLQNKHFDGEDAAVKGQNYKYAHDFENHWVEQQYLPDVLKDVKYYTFGDNRTEQAARAYWAKIKGEDKL